MKIQRKNSAHHFHMQSEHEQTLVSSGQTLYRAALLETNYFSTSLLQRFTAESSRELRRNAVP